MGIEHFSFTKKRLQRLGSWILRRASETTVPDATSGFRAYNREAALSLTVVSKFTYTLESLIQAGKSLVAVTDVPVATNDKTRESRLFGSMSAYVRRNAAAIFRIYAGYEPLFVFSVLAAIVFGVAVLAWMPFLVDWLVNGRRDGHVQSILLGGVLFVAAIQLFALGVIADLISAHRTVSQRTLERVRRLELQLGVEPSHYIPGPEASSGTVPAVNGAGRRRARVDGTGGDRAATPGDAEPGATQTVGEGAADDTAAARARAT
jgi:hypothetical protein